jgi:HK97 family phage major capsid protein
LSYPVYTDPNVASLASNARIVAFGDWNAYYVRQVGGVVIERSDDFAFNTDLVTFRGKTRVDGDTVDLTAANILKQSV